MVKTDSIINRQFVLNWKHIIGIFLLSRLIIGILYIFSANFRNISLLDGSTYCTFDCNWYLSIIKYGYTHYPVIVDQSNLEQSNLAFSPLMPLMIKLFISPFILIFGDQFVGVIALTFGIILNNLLLLGSLHLFRIYLNNKIDSTRLTILLIMFCLSPLNIYINSLYAESLYLFLCLLLVVQIESKKFHFGSFVMSLVSICKPQGVFFMPLFLYFMYSAKEVKTFHKPIYLLISLLPVSLFFFYTYILTNDLFFYFHLQDNGWGFSLSKIFRIAMALELSELPSFLNSNKLNLFCFFVYLAVCIQLLCKKFLIEFFFFLPIFLISFLSFHIEFRWALSSYAFYLSLVLFKKLTHVYLVLGITLVTLFNYVLSWTSGLGPF